MKSFWRSRFLIMLYTTTAAYSTYPSTPPIHLQAPHSSSEDTNTLLQWGRLVALWLCFFQGLGFSMSLTMVSSNIAGSTKKQLTSAILFTGYW